MTFWCWGYICNICFFSRQSWWCKQGHSPFKGSIIQHAGGCCYSAPLRCIERIAAVQIPFFVCARGTIYNSAIELFMCLHRLSLDATGHVWEGGNVFMALFLISQATFSPLPLLPPNRTPTLHGVQSRHAARLRLKIISTRCFLRQCCVHHPWMSRRSRWRGRALVLRLTRPHS